jgi:spermidine synthase
VILAGASAMASQIVFMREFLVVFYGNEISVGIILAGWLIWGAFGSAFLGRLSDRISARIRIFWACQLCLSVVFPLTLLLLRSSRSFLGMSTGEIMGYYPMLLCAFLVLFLPCSIMGFMFSLACRIYRDEEKMPAVSIARIYVMEAVGALSGGLLVSYLLIRYMTPSAILLLLSFLNLSASLMMQRYGESFKRKNAVVFATVVLLVLGTGVVLAGGGKWFRDVSLERLWSGFSVLRSKDSVYGNITVTERGQQRSFYENGLHLYTVPDLLSAEEAVHFTMLQAPDPEKVLLIGGGVGGKLKEILKYPVKRVDYVELDPTIIKLAERYLDRTDVTPLKDPRVNIINEDGRFFVKNTDDRYDCVIIDLGDPYTAQINRFYTVEFYEELKRIMKDGGIVGFALTSSANYISGELRDYLRSIYLSARSVFQEVIIIPGDTAYFILSNKPGILTDDVGELEKRLEERGIDTSYVRGYYLVDKLSKERIRYAKDAVEEDVKVGLNRDFRPVSYFYSTVFWGTQFDMPAFRKMLRSIKAENIWIASSFFCLLILLAALAAGARIGKRTALLAIMTTGFAEIIFQIAVILSFQVIYGYVFYKLGVIITSFMVGLALGGWAISRSMGKIRNDMGLFTWTQLSICLYPLLLPVVFRGLSAAPAGPLSWLGANVIFPFLPVISGFIGGVQFPLANKIYLERAEETGRVAGLSYGLDLLGACLGALLAAAILIPVLGIFKTCYLAALINTTVLGLLLAAIFGRK